jgi:hypothetical protein
MKEHRVEMGALPPNPRDLSLSRRDILFDPYRAACAAPAISASESALGAHPCVALSSARLNDSYRQKAINFEERSLCQ